MALPFRPQPLLRFVTSRKFDRAFMCDYLGIPISRYANLLRGRAYPSPDEIAKLVALIELPIEVIFDAELLVYRNGPWPPKRGAGAVKADLDRAHAELDQLRKERGK